MEARSALGVLIMETYKLSSFRPRPIVIEGRDASGALFDFKPGDAGVTVTENGKPFAGELYHLNVGETATVGASVVIGGKRYSVSLVVEGSDTEGSAELILTMNTVEDVEAKQKEKEKKKP